MPPQRAEVLRYARPTPSSPRRKPCSSDSQNRSNRVRLALLLVPHAAPCWFSYCKWKEVKTMRKLLIGATIALSVLLPLGVAYAAPSDNPDPDPDNGQDCQENGNNGGNNAH